MVHRKGAESCWDYSDSDTKYKINYTLIRSTEPPTPKRKKKRDVSYGLSRSVFLTEDLNPIYYSCLPDRICLPPP